MGIVEDILKAEMEHHRPYIDKNINILSIIFNAIPKQKVNNLSWAGVWSEFVSFQTLFHEKKRFSVHDLEEKLGRPLGGEACQALLYHQVRGELFTEEDYDSECLDKEDNLDEVQKLQYTGYLISTILATLSGDGVSLKDYLSMEDNYIVSQWEERFRNVSEMLEDFERIKGEIGDKDWRTLCWVLHDADVTSVTQLGKTMDLYKNEPR